jgi:hypothetical protein
VPRGTAAALRPEYPDGTSCFTSVIIYGRRLR